MDPALCYDSRNNSCLRRIHPLPIRITLYVILGVTIILTVCGNLLVIVSVAYFKQLHTPTNYLILSLAVSDLLFGIVVMFPLMIQTIETCWYFGEFFCKIYLSSGVMLGTASIVNLSFISIDRYYAVCKPLLYTRKISVLVALIMILISWGISALTGFGMIFLNLTILGVEEFYSKYIVCEGGCFTYQSPLSSTLSSTLSFHIPGIIMLSVYLKIFLVAQRQVNSIQKAGCVSTAKVTNTSQRKATKTLAIIMGAFLSFWTPFFTFNIINPFISYPKTPEVFATLAWIGSWNSTINPIIYAFFYSWFRKAIKLVASGKIFISDLSETTLFTE